MASKVIPLDEEEGTEGERIAEAIGPVVSTCGRVGRS